MKVQPEVVICEVGPRDGLQMVTSRMPTPIKVAWVRSLAAAGLRDIEIGSFVPASVLPQMADTAEVFASVRDLPGVHFSALVPNLHGARAAYAAGLRSIVIPVSVSEGHSQSNLRKSREEQIEQVRRVVEFAQAQDEPLEVQAGCATAFGCSIDGRISTAQVLETANRLCDAGVSIIHLADTLGYATPSAVHELVTATRDAIGDRLGGLHLHDTLGMALANAQAGYAAGIRRFDGALGGLGGCPFAPGAAGNVATDDLVGLFEMQGISTGIDIDRLMDARNVLSGGLPEEVLRGSLAASGLSRADLNRVRPRVSAS